MSKNIESENRPDMGLENEFKPESIEKSKIESEPEEDVKKEFLEIDHKINSETEELRLAEQGLKEATGQGIESPGLSEKRRKSIEKLNALDQKKSDWITENGLEELPEGLVYPDGENGRAMKMNVVSEQAETMPLEDRRRLLDKWKKEFVEGFVRAIRADWRAMDSVNVSMAIETMKNNAPLAIEKQAKSFLRGETDQLNVLATIKWETSSIFEIMSGEPRQIKNLKIDFGDETETLADASALEAGETEKPDLKQAA